MKTKKRVKENRAWFEQKMNELVQVIEQIPEDRQEQVQLELFKDAESSVAVSAGVNSKAGA